MATPAPASIDQRFAQLIQQFGLTKNSFAISLGKTASVIQHLIDGRNKPGYDLLCKVFEIYPNVSRDWLLLGRGPMLVGGEPAPKVTQPAPPSAVESPLEPIDLSDVEISPSRRSSNGSGARLQPAEIVATLALAAAANQPARAATPVLNGTAPALGGIAAAPPESTRVASEEKHLAPPAASETSLPLSPPPAPAPAAEALPNIAPAAPAASSVPTPSPEAYVAAALHAQHLQHQLAMAEMRNQHLLEQQQMLREMLAMARQAMV
ncbi:MAG TPA: helix-turn-helix transcriptional regulator [Hymenobacter sp.]|jgi:hypothetical protein|uniref:helix-turn-helix transcriptional regulator n=1 Tax=Hymenobacter sp. TaxID=1898978 RepID=UPI002EDB92D6